MPNLKSLSPQTLAMLAILAAAIALFLIFPALARWALILALAALAGWATVQWVQSRKAKIPPADPST